MDGGEPGAGRRFRRRAGPERRAVRAARAPDPGRRARRTAAHHRHAAELDGLSHLVRTGCRWRHLPPPPAFPPWRTVYGHTRAFAAAGVREGVRRHLVVRLRERDGKGPSPSAAIVDTQSVETTEKGGPAAEPALRPAYGWTGGTRPGRSRADAAGKVEGRKRHVAVDTGGLPLGVIVHAADVRDADGAGDLPRRLRRLCCWLRVVLADGVHDRLPALLACFLLGLTLVVVRRLAGGTGLVLPPRRWVAERTPARLGRRRRLAGEHEELPEVSETMVKPAMIRLMPHRLARPSRKRLPAH